MKAKKRFRNSETPFNCVLILSQIQSIYNTSFTQLVSKIPLQGHRNNKGTAMQSLNYYLHFSKRPGTFAENGDGFTVTGYGVDVKSLIAYHKINVNH